MVVLLKDGELLAVGDTRLLVNEAYIRKANMHLPIIFRTFKMVPELLTDSSSKRAGSTSIIV
ncbi:hypothetical protein QGM71_17705 [Virgibacillus sp. C22-A2]|uniref:Uncharacterized protein n=1 Tax=Virgibacillus tibetensis TaxID=3042313 RepID=A0ABU6KJA9_9BACI|nr:hypothetical protein [Virgibacillus sp. C22-A2]